MCVCLTFAFTILISYDGIKFICNSFNYRSGALDNYFRVNRQQRTVTDGLVQYGADEVSSEDSSTDQSTDLSESEESGSSTEIEDDYGGNESVATSGELRSFVSLLMSNCFT